MPTTDPSAKNPLRWIPTTWFAMGLPNLVLGGTVVSLLYKSMGYTDSQIAFWTGIIILPWSFKPLWGPFMELYMTKKFYIYISQLCCALLLAISALTLYSDSFFTYSVVLFFVTAFFGATQDIAADGLYLQELSEKQQARFVGWQGTFYNVAKLFSNGGMVFLAGILMPLVDVGEKHPKDSWAIVLMVYAVTMLVLGLYNRSRLPDSASAAKGTAAVASTQREVWSTLRDVMVSFFTKKYVLWGVLFIMLYRFAEGQAIKIMPLFLKAERSAGGLGLTEATVGLLTGVYGTIAFVLGSLLAGYFVANKGLTRKTLMVLCACFNLPFAAYTYLALTQTSTQWVVGLAISVEHFGYGFGFIGLILFIMQQLAPGRYQMAHYAFGSALTYFGYTLASMISGAISDALGYQQFFLWVLVSTIPAFVVSWLVPLKKIDSVQ